MKKSINAMTIFLSLVTLLSAASCSKVEKDGFEDSTVFTLGDCNEFKFDVMATKAVKSDWAEGDILNLWFANPGKCEGPDLQLVYHDGAWKSKVINANCPVTDGGRFVCCYEGFNNIGLYSHSFNGYYSNNFLTPSKQNTYTGGKIAYATPMMIGNKNPLTYSLQGRTITASVNDWTFYTPTKFLIKNDNGMMTGSASDYYLMVEPAYSGGWNYPLRGVRGIVIDCDSTSLITATPMVDTASDYVIGVSEPDGIAFYFDSTKDLTKGIRLTLSGPSLGGNVEYVVQNPPASDTISSNHCTGFTVKYSKFCN